MYVIKAVFKNMETGEEFTYYVGKIMKNKVFTFENRSISAEPDKVIGYKSYKRCMKAAYLYFLHISDDSFHNGYTVTVNPMEVIKK